MNFVLKKIGKLLTLQGAVAKRGRNIESNDLSVVNDAALVIGNNNKIQWTGPEVELPSKFKKYKKINAKGAMVMPGFVDSHTHLVFGGDRSQEFEMRLAGKSYEDIASHGGGIIKTVLATRGMSEKELYLLALDRTKSFLKQGVTTFEVKTGYGLSFEAEKKCLNIIQKLKKNSKATILSTFLAAHAVPDEFKGRRTEYIEEISQNWLPKIFKLCDFVDIFLDRGYFDTFDASILIAAAKQFDLPTKIHADELELTGGAKTAVESKSLSADHLLKISDREIALLAASETTATLLPTTAFFLNVDYAPARKLLDSGARIALATDFNPGTSPTQDISLVGVLAALKMNMRIEEIIVALTLNGAFALGLENQKGALLAGYDADFFLIEAENPAKLFYEFGAGKPGPLKVFARGNWTT